MQLVCSRCSKSPSFRYTDTKCTCGGSLLVQYDLERISRSLTKKILKTRYPSMWKYEELLPVTKNSAIVTLGEGWTPLVRMQQEEKKLPVKQLWIKREEQNPTGSFKARGFSAALSLLMEQGLNKPAVPSNGNAASALAAYAGRAGMQAFVFIPKDCPPLIVQECIQYGASTYLVDGYIHDANAIIEEGRKEQGWATVATLKEFGRVEGKKTMGLELAEQLNWKLPDVIVYPTGGGSGIIGMWKAFRELIALGWVEGPLPRMVSVQEKGCQPIVDAMNPPVPPPSNPIRPVTSPPTGMRVPSPPDLDLIIRIIKETRGTAVAVNHNQIAEAQHTLGALGISSSPEGAATWAGLLALCDNGWIQSKDTVVLFNTSHALKYNLSDSIATVPTIRSYQEFLSSYERT